MPAIMKAWSWLSIWQGPVISESRPALLNTTFLSLSPTETLELAEAAICYSSKPYKTPWPGYGDSSTRTSQLTKCDVISSNDDFCHGQIKTAKYRRLIKVC
jgi:hypothetical protein